jgi:hypothetical protein
MDPLHLSFNRRQGSRDCPGDPLVVSLPLKCRLILVNLESSFKHIQLMAMFFQCVLTYFWDGMMLRREQLQRYR